MMAVANVTDPFSSVVFRRCFPAFSAADKFGGGRCGTTHRAWENEHAGPENVPQEIRGPRRAPGTAASVSKGRCQISIDGCERETASNTPILPARRASKGQHVTRPRSAATPRPVADSPRSVEWRGFQLLVEVM